MDVPAVDVGLIDGSLDAVQLGDGDRAGSHGDLVGTREDESFAHAVVGGELLKVPVAGFRFAGLPCLVRAFADAEIVGDESLRSLSA